MSGRSLREVLEAGLRHREASTGAPPPRGPGSARLYLIVPNLVDHRNKPQADWGVFMIKEKRNSKWAAPGGKTDKTDHSTLHCAMREFTEETGGGRPELIAARMGATVPSVTAQYIRLIPAVDQTDAADEDWALVIAGHPSINTAMVERYLWGDNATWPSYTNEMKANTVLKHDEISGYCWMSLFALADFETSPITRPKLLDDQNRPTVDMPLRRQEDVIAAAQSARLLIDSGNIRRY